MSILNLSASTADAKPEPKIHALDEETRRGNAVRRRLEKLEPIGAGCGIGRKTRGLPR